MDLTGDKCMVVYRLVRTMSMGHFCYVSLFAIATATWSGEIEFRTSIVGIVLLVTVIGGLMINPSNTLILDIAGG